MESNSKAWRASFFWVRVAEVGTCCARVRALIVDDALPLLESPSLWRTESRRLERSLQEASSCLVKAIAIFEEAELLGFQASNRAFPMVPLPSVDLVRHKRGGNDHAMWLALRRLEEANAHALDAITRVENCRGHLLAALSMPRLPMGHDAVVDAKRHEAEVELSAAKREVVNMTFLADLAPNPPMNIGIKLEVS